MAARRLGKLMSTLLRRLRIITSLSRRRSEGVFLGRRASAAFQEVLAEAAHRAELARRQDRDQAVQLHQVVLDGRSGEHEHIALADLVDELPGERAAVFELVRFVHNEQVIVAGEDSVAVAFAFGAVQADDPTALVCRVHSVHSSALSMTVNSSWNLLCNSSRHCSVSEAGVRTSTVRTRPRWISSFMMMPASMVLPRPTSSASRARPRIWCSALMAVSIWCW